METEDIQESPQNIEIIIPDDVSSKLKSNVTLTDITCPICDRKLPGTGNLSFHMALHPVDRPQTCDYCVKVFRTKDELNTHLQTDHERQYMCETCGQTFAVASRLKRHLWTHNTDKPYKCAYCDDAFRNYDNWRHHEVQHRGPTEFKCDLCHVGFWLRGRYLEHVELGNCTGAINCCEQIFQSRLEYVDHFMKKHHRTDPEEHGCQYCHKLFPYVSSKRKHEEVCGKGNFRRPRDPNNSRKMKNSPDQQDTIAIPEPNEEGLYQCHICEMAVKSVAGLKLHVTRQHMPPEDENMKKFHCPVCDKRYSTLSAVYIHKQTHFKKHSCTVCSKRFAHKCLLRNHMYTHDKIKPFKCQHCDKTFASRIQASEHENFHTGNRPYKCRYCDDRFKRRTAFMYHELIHTGERRYKCKICGIGFTQSSTCKQHEKAHERCVGKRKFCCKECPAVFWSVTQLKAHKQEMHEEQIVEEEIDMIPKIQLVAEDGEHWVQPTDMTTDDQGNVYLYV